MIEGNASVGSIADGVVFVAAVADVVVVEFLDVEVVEVFVEGGERGG